MSKPLKIRGRRREERGFTLTEVLVSTVILLVGLVGVAQLVPVSIRLNSANRYDSTALAVAQREMNYMLTQPLTNSTFQDPQGVMCPAGNICNLGNAAQPNQVVGSPVITPNNRPLIDFSAGQVAGYSFNYADPNDPGGKSYDIRWAVVTFVGAGNTTGRRLIVGTLPRGGNGPFLAITLDSMVQK
ncbi:MAG TPA: prepilin-type N-terminal cleavage/methylation domain-containing protein [Candidatus Dormibacteraeota bacterium]|nr:prepilin-type N-terminal cleavage/methylation domain-containing protein [Candidatus Dormibacteraeota bacterium]